jgi:CheY-like chemotaxis protein
MRISGIQAVQEIRPQVILADLIMPELDGFYLLRQKKLSRIVITGGAGKSSLPECGIANWNRRSSKPA